MITAILLDAGGVILDETEHEKTRADIITRVLSRHDAGYSLERYHSDVKRAVDCYAPRVYEYIIWQNTKNPDMYFKVMNDYGKMFSQINPPLVLMKGIGELLSCLSKKYTINLAGQYGEEILGLMERNGLMDFFENRITQDDFHLTKPDPRYYEMILEKIAKSPDECIMIGDRIDKDIIPARQVGMKTIRIRTGLHAGQEPRSYDEFPDEEVMSLPEIPGKIRIIEEKTNL